MILDDIVADRKKEYEIIEEKLPLDELIKKIKIDENPIHKLYDLCAKKDFIYICECKKASPSKGLIEPDYHPDIQARVYSKSGADMISCLTEPKYFLGSNEDLAKVIKNKGNSLVLRKDFIFSEYQIYESKYLGVDTILLICAILDKDTLKKYLDLAHKLGLSCLVETHNENEITMAKECGAKVIGVNNRNLKDFSVDNSLSLKLREKYPDLFLISESGVKDINDIKNIKNSKLNGVLMGEVLMRSKNPEKTLKEFIKC
ncbi:MAG: indole-3-glycerol phosphate synthase TrpC [Acholeplasmatales bacterium]|nr:indole-3-glycerol phosphate synthase TrpC [Acholeplasmatales bacterium]